MQHFLEGAEMKPRENHWTVKLVWGVTTAVVTFPRWVWVSRN